METRIEKNHTKNSNNNSQKKPFDKKVNNGEGVKVAFTNAVGNISKKLESLWVSEGGKKYLVHLIFSFLPPTEKKVYKISSFDEHSKYSELPKICSLTGFAVSDINFTMDDVTKKFFEQKEKKVNKLVHAIACSGSTDSNKILSNDALIALNDWFQSKISNEIANDKVGDFTKLMRNVVGKNEGEKKNNVDKTKKVKFHNPTKGATYSLADKFNFNSLDINDKGGKHEKQNKKSR